MLAAWLRWLESRPAGYTRTRLWTLKIGRSGFPDPRGADLRSPLSWLVDQFLAAHPDRGHWINPEPGQRRFDYRLMVDGQEYLSVPPRAVLDFAGLNEGSKNAVIEFARKAASHQDFARRLRAALWRPKTQYLLSDLAPQRDNS